MLSKHDAIDTAMVRHLVAAQAIRGASIVGVPGGWSVLLKLGLHEHVLCAQRGERAPRMAHAGRLRRVPARRVAPGALRARRLQPQ